MLNPLTHRKLLKKGTPGRATIVEMGALNRGGTSFGALTDEEFEAQKRRILGG